MKKHEKDYTLATPEMVDKIIEEHYAEDFQEMEFLLQSIAAVNRPEIDVEKIVADTIAGREKLVMNVSVYEDELVKMLDLATVILERHNHGNDENLEEYVNYLLEKNIAILPDIIEIIQLLKK